VLAASVVFIVMQWEPNAGSDGTSIQWQPGLPSVVAGVQPGVTVTAPAVGSDPAPSETAAAMTPTPSRDRAQASGGGALSAEQRRTLAPNELGLVPVLMYHDIIDVPETDVAYTRTLADFRAELQRLYDANYHVIPLQDLVSGQLDVPAGKHPVVLTFDDGIANQFRFLIAADGSTSIDPTSAAFSPYHPPPVLTGHRKGLSRTSGRTAPRSCSGCSITGTRLETTRMTTPICSTWTTTRSGRKSAAA
jgi:hypothetical protein